MAVGDIRRAVAAGIASSNPSSVRLLVVSLRAHTGVIVAAAAADQE